ncbi:MAG: hypothetical protein RIQ60_3762 [Pseudomonadota bacterium]|jgi:hypothetical protein
MDDDFPLPFDREYQAKLFVQVHGDVRPMSHHDIRELGALFY